MLYVSVEASIGEKYLYHIRVLPNANFVIIHQTKISVKNGEKMGSLSCESINVSEKIFHPVFRASVFYLFVIGIYSGTLKISSTGFVHFDRCDLMVTLHCCLLVYQNTTEYSFAVVSSKYFLKTYHSLATVSDGSNTFMNEFHDIFMTIGRQNTSLPKVQQQTTGTVKRNSK